MDNPVARVLRLAGLSNAAFRTRWEFSQDGLVQALNGSYTSLPERMIEAVEQAADFAGLNIDAIMSNEYKADNIEEAYTLWQIQQRLDNRDKLFTPREGWMFRSDAHKSPAHYFMVDSSKSRDRFAKDFCLPRATLMRWERGITKGMPVVVHEMLHEVKYRHIAALVEEQAAWVQEHL